MNTETQHHSRELQTKAVIVAGSIDQMIESSNVDSWLLITALRKVRKLEGEDMTEASALLQALLDRMQDCRTIYYARDQAQELLSGLGVKEADHE